MKILPAMKQLGSPKLTTFEKGTLATWSAAPFVATQIEGYAEVAMARTIESLYKDHFPLIEFVVTVHDWSKLTDYDIECRKIMQQLTHFMRPKQRELLIHLGPASGLGQKVIRTAVETMARLKKLHYEIFSDDVAFQKRVRELLITYPDRKQVLD